MKKIKTDSLALLSCREFCAALGGRYICINWVGYEIGENFMRLYGLQGLEEHYKEAVFRHEKNKLS